MADESPQNQWTLEYVGERQEAKFITLTIAGRRNFNRGDIVTTKEYSEVAKAVSSKMFKVVKQPNFGEKKATVPPVEETTEEDPKPKIKKVGKDSQGKTN